MKKQIERVSVMQNAKMVAVLYLVLSVPALAIFYGFAAMTGQGALSVVAMVVFPLAYGVSGFVTTLIGAWLYNLVASLVGGFEFTTKEVSAG